MIAPLASVSMLAASVPLTETDPRISWAPVLLLLVIAILFAVSNVGLSLILGPSRTGPGKEQTYESGMVPIGDTRQRFNVRFYVVAMIFLVFDVDIIFMYPWATIFLSGVRHGAPLADAVAAAQTASGTHGMDMAGMLLLEMVIFIALLLVAYFYAWGKGVFRWD